VGQRNLASDHLSSKHFDVDQFLPRLWLRTFSRTGNLGGEKLSEESREHQEKFGGRLDEYHPLRAFEWPISTQPHAGPPNFSSLCPRDMYNSEIQTSFTSLRDHR
jgi:hypothetical protein